jgi:aspartyl-tRNA(Asn)/glutamyl-tRNA(Gln) amidotransferase subunit A
VPIEVPEAHEIDEVFAHVVPAELLAYLGRERVIAGQDVVDPVVWGRVSQAMEFDAIDYIRLVQRQRALCAIANKRMRRLDGWITPTVNRVALPLADYRTVGAAAAWNALTSRNSRPANLFGQCAISIPIQREPAALPVGLQIVCNGGEDHKLLSIALAIEEILGPSPRGDVAAFIA